MDSEEEAEFDSESYQSTPQKVVDFIGKTFRRCLSVPVQLNHQICGSYRCITLSSVLAKTEFVLLEIGVS